MENREEPARPPDAPKRRRTGKKAWVCQLAPQVRKLGAANAAWYVSWVEADSLRCKYRSCGPGAAGKKNATRLADKIHS